VIAWFEWAKKQRIAAFGTIAMSGELVYTPDGELELQEIIGRYQLED
jgi:hypothetical protein